MSCCGYQDGASKTKKLGPPFVQAPENVGSHDFEAIASTMQQLIKGIDSTCAFSFETAERPENMSCTYLYEYATPILTKCYENKDGPFEEANQGLLLLLEHCLAFHLRHLACISHFVQGLGNCIGEFLRENYNCIAHCDRRRNTAYCIVLMQQLTLYDIVSSTGILNMVFFKVPALKEVILTEQPHGGASASGGINSPKLRENANQLTYAKQERRSEEAQRMIPEQEQGRLVAMSNAPPIKVKIDESGAVKIEQGSGGLVTCCEPAIRDNSNNVWLVCLGSSIPVATPAGRGDAMPTKDTETSKIMLVEDRLKEFCRDHYQLRSVSVPKHDYDIYYGGISNGLLWPALHHLNEYVAQEYENPFILTDHWHAYMRVNFYFAVDALRKCGNLDFLWVHDYHLTLVAMIMRMYKPKIETGFFLHIPFDPSKDFFAKYHPMATIILRALLKFQKVGFQTTRDAERFIGYIQERLDGVVVVENTAKQKWYAEYQGVKCSIGVFPVSVKNDDFLKLTYDQEIQTMAAAIREQIMGRRNGKLFLSAERLDYTKGIKERLIALELYMNKYPERAENDRFIQVAIINRSSIRAYRKYQEGCLEIARRIQGRFETEEKCPLIMITTGLPRRLLVAHYLAMDIGLVTSLADGMNLVAKEMLLCNPNARLILSVGTGFESQLCQAGFYPEKGERYYMRVDNIKNAEQYCDILYRAATEESHVAVRHGLRLQQFIANNDIEKWRHNYLDPLWDDKRWESRNVTTLEEFYKVARKIRHLRRRIVASICQGLGSRKRDWASLDNMLTSLMQSCPANTLTKILVKTRSGNELLIDVNNELVQLHKELKFSQLLPLAHRDLDFKNFSSLLAEYTTLSKADFAEEIRKARLLIGRQALFDFFVSSFYGTLTRRTSTTHMSQQPMYGALVVNCFSRQCTARAVIISSRGLRNPGLLDDFPIDTKTIDFGGFMGQEWKFFSQDFEMYSCLPVFPASVQEHMVKLYQRVREAANDPGNEIFNVIGGGICLHAHCLMVPQQDCYSSIPMPESNRWCSQVKDIVADVGSLSSLCDVQDNGTHILVQMKQSGPEGKFTKADGLAVYCEKMGISISQQKVLVCGSSVADLPMIEYLLSRNAESVSAVWVESNVLVRHAVNSLFKKYGNDNIAFVSFPEVLIAALAEPLLVDEMKRMFAEPSL
ncbi:hypothetical protein M514_02925 [Trichuris suis]|uniref:Trehalose-6-phosphate synthase domain protein n=1 Tax=Trichuris suis TaxID=68888 RepID=A0A085NB25_9BILA|nr:hypothetical protein M513_02925 [Trichuris suis]KFD66671.1 hypothetical protein M514_02925 [Trichuris suis]